MRHSNLSFKSWLTGPEYHHIHWETFIRPGLKFYIQRTFSWHHIAKLNRLLMLYSIYIVIIYSIQPEKLNKERIRQNKAAKPKTWKIKPTDLFLVLNWKRWCSFPLFWMCARFSCSLSMFCLLSLIDMFIITIHIYTINTDLIGCFTSNLFFF